MPKCTFCGINIKKGTGKMFVYTSGKVANFCSNKCEKNLLKLKRKPLKTRWTQEWIKENKKVSDGKKEETLVVEPAKQEATEKKPKVKKEKTETKPTEEAPEVKVEEKAGTPEATKKLAKETKEDEK